MGEPLSPQAMMTAVNSTGDSNSAKSTFHVGVHPFLKIFWVSSAEAGITAAESGTGSLGS